MDRLAPSQSATRPRARQRPQPDAENFGGEVSFEPPSPTPFTSLDHLVGDGEYPWGYLDPQRSRSLKVDDQLELRRLRHRQVGGLRAFEDFAGIDAHLTKRFREVGPVAHQPADFHKFAPRIGRRNPAARRQSG